jgi:hypothetical protein
MEMMLVSKARLHVGELDAFSFWGGLCMVVH